jgi:histidyl-tRNA synthetase
MSLARGLDYYTGVIYEAILKQESVTKNEVGMFFYTLLFTYYLFSICAHEVNITNPTLNLIG